MKRKPVVRMMTCTAMLIILLATACTQAASAATADQVMDKQLQPGGKGAYVTWFQKQLKRLGYYEGGLSNVYSRRTQRATKDFQRANSLKQTGKGNKQTRELAFSKGAITRAQYDKANFISELKPGDTGDQVLQYQGRLVHYGYLAEASGAFDDATKLATKYFQSANKLTASGTATRSTRTLINKDSGVVSYAAYEAAQATAGFKRGGFGLGIASAQQRLQELGYYDGAISPTYTDEFAKSVVQFKQFNNFKNASTTITSAERAAMNSPDMLSYSAVYGPDTLKPGDKGMDVLEAQVILRELKYYRGSLNAKYSSAMVSSVKRFQRAYKLYPTGYLLSTSMAILDKYSGRGDGVNAKAYVAIDKAQDVLGKKYKSGAAGPEAFDCSGFTYFVFKKAGVTLAQSASSQSQRGKLVPGRDAILPGDLVFFATGSSTTRVNHVGLVYSVDDGNIKFVHASSARGKVITSSFKDSENDDFYNKRFLWARRMW